MLPPAGEYLSHPLASVGTLIEVMRLHEAHKTAAINEKRRRNVEDVAKRAAYRKAHGLPDAMGLFNQPMARIRSDEEMAALEAGDNGSGGGAKSGEGVESGEGGEEQPAKKESEARRLTEEERQAVVQKAKQKWMGVW
jgi:hypothetical protein